MKGWVLNGFIDFFKMIGFVVVIAAVVGLFIATCTAMGINVGYGYLAFYAMIMLGISMAAAKFKGDAEKLKEKTFDIFDKNKKEKK